MIEVRCKVCALRQKPCFRPLSAPEVKFVSGMRRGRVSLEPGRFLAKAGDVPKAFYTLLEGWAAVYVELPHQPPHMIDIVLPGDLISMQGCLIGRHTHSVMALTPVRFCSLDKSFLEELVERHNEFSLAMMRHLAAEQARREIHAALMGAGSPVQRLAYLFLEIFARLKAVGMADETMCPFPLRRSHLGELIGLSEVHLNRTLAALKRDELVHFADNLLVIPDQPRLAEIAKMIPPVSICGRMII